MLACWRYLPLRRVLQSSTWCAASHAAILCKNYYSELNGWQWTHMERLRVLGYAIALSLQLIVSDFVLNPVYCHRCLVYRHDSSNVFHLCVLSHGLSNWDAAQGRSHEYNICKVTQVKCICTWYAWSGKNSKLTKQWSNATSEPYVLLACCVEWPISGGQLNCWYCSYYGNRQYVSLLITFIRLSGCNHINPACANNWHLAVTCVKCRDALNHPDKFLCSQNFEERKSCTANCDRL